MQGAGSLFRNASQRSSRNRWKELWTRYNTVCKEFHPPMYIMSLETQSKTQEQPRSDLSVAMSAFSLSARFSIVGVGKIGSSTSNVVPRSRPLAQKLSRRPSSGCPADCHQQRMLVNGSFTRPNTQAPRMRRLRLQPLASGKWKMGQRSRSSPPKRRSSYYHYYRGCKLETVLVHCLLGPFCLAAQMGFNCPHQFLCLISLQEFVEKMVRFLKSSSCKTAETCIFIARMLMEFLFLELPWEIM